MLRRGAATDLMGQVGDALAAPRSAYVHVQRSTWRLDVGGMGWLMQVLSVRGAKSVPVVCRVSFKHTAEADSTDTAFQGHTTPKFALPGARALK